MHLLSLSEPSTNDSSASGFLTSGFFDLLAEYYSVELSQKVSSGWQKRAEKGLTLGDVPFGYARARAQEPVAPVPDEAEAVREMFRLYATGTRSMSEVADWLNAQGFTPRSKRGKGRFSKASVQGMLKNPTYAGYVSRHGEIVGQGRHEAIVPRPLFEAVQETIERRSRKPRAYRPAPPYPYLLSGIAVCGSCGGPIWANSARQHTYHYYRCAARHRGEVCQDQSVGIRAGEVDGQIASMFERMRLPPTWQARVRELAARPVGREGVEAERLRVEGEIEGAGRAFVAGLLSESKAQGSLTRFPGPP